MNKARPGQTHLALPAPGTVQIPRGPLTLVGNTGRGRLVPVAGPVQGPGAGTTAVICAEGHAPEPCRWSSPSPDRLPQVWGILPGRGRKHGKEAPRERAGRPCTGRAWVRHGHYRWVGCRLGSGAREYHRPGTLHLPLPLQPWPQLPMLYGTNRGNPRLLGMDRLPAAWFPLLWAMPVSLSGLWRVVPGSGRWNSGPCPPDGGTYQLPAGCAAQTARCTLDAQNQAGRRDASLVRIRGHLAQPDRRRKRNCRFLQSRSDTEKCYYVE